MGKIFWIAVVIFLGLGVLLFSGVLKSKPKDIVENIVQKTEDAGGPTLRPHPLSIESLRGGEYPGSDLSIEKTLDPGSNYQRHIVSYKSEGLKIYALLTVPTGISPEGGWPAVIFNHGYIPPSEYRTTERYNAYTDAFSRNGYILLKPDYRGHGNSEGQAQGGYGSNGYTIDVLNALSSLKKYPGVDSNRIGMWGHSMGGFITLRSMVVSKDIKAGVIWGGVVANYQDLVERWRRRSPPSSPLPGNTRGRWRQSLIEQYGQPSANPEFWNSISANAFLRDISGPLQLHHGEADSSVPLAFSQKLEEQMRQAGKETELFVYPGDDHNITANFGIAAQRSVEFFEHNFN